MSTFTPPSSNTPPLALSSGANVPFSEAPDPTDDAVMAATYLRLDPESEAGPTRNSVAGFDLAHSRHWGQPASVVVDELARHLIDKGRAHAGIAHQGASLLLARVAPEYLVKDIPSSVPYGSVLWVQLTMAVARIEAQTPGSTLGMGYAEIFLAAEKLNTDATLTQQIAYDALRDWGVANGFLAAPGVPPSANEMERVRIAFNHQLEALKTTSTLLQTQIPSRRDMALAQLEQTFPDLDKRLFEVRNLHKAWLKKGRPGVHPGARSMLDIVMEGGKLGAQEHWLSNDKRLPVTRFCDLYSAGKLGVAAPFKEAFDTAIHAHAEGHQNRVRQLIATLPLEDRKNLEYGELAFFHTNQYKIAGDLFTPPALHVRGHTLEVKATRNGQVNLYTIDTRRGTIEKDNFLIRRRTEPYTASKMEERDANILSKTVLFEPDKEKYASQFQTQPEGARPPDSFNSARSRAIADVFVQSLDLKNDDLLNEARDTTSYDQERTRNAAISEFFLNLIPFRSAIVNFQNGNVGQGLFDLGMDVVGLVTLGAGKAAQAGKVLGSAVSTLGQAAKAARFVGATAIEAFNPLSGGDLLVDGGRWLLNGGRHAAAKVSRQLSRLKDSAGELNNQLYREFKVPASRIAGLSPNSQGVYVSVDGHMSHIRHTDSAGHTAIYEVRQVGRTQDGRIQARVYHNDRQTPLLLERVQGDQWQRLGIRGGSPVSVKADLGPQIGQGGEGVVYASLDGKSVYKDLGPTRLTTAEGHIDMQVVNLNKYYGDGFAEVMIDEGRKYIKMRRIEGVDLSQIEKGSLPPNARTLIDDVLAQMEAKDIFHNDPQLKNFMYSSKENKIYPIDLDGMSAEFMVPVVRRAYDRQTVELRNAFRELIAQEP
ncbi:hypothetical protein [Pseudomonas sp. NFACC42-2]|uniref:OspG family effector kinase n=1 Tax=Pseudomonas sp. NFACC42-2 TaxID=1566193 RepID=UPI0008EC26DB|nr:hypothetical protein [Pseudomonas sp. NFACC42-2]SFS25847.1 hypothetical protein SAMN03159318_02109 [Pseudomonas sp. NFACC42-2]